MVTVSLRGKSRGQDRRVSKETVTGVLWLQAEQWQRLREMAHDPEEFHLDYQTWRRTAEQVMATIRDTGHKVVKVEVDLEDLAAWCRARLRPLDASARSEYVAKKVSERDLKHSMRKP